MPAYKFEITLEVEVDPDELGIEYDAYDTYEDNKVLIDKPKEKIEEIIDNDLDLKLNAEIVNIEHLETDASDVEPPDDEFEEDDDDWWNEEEWDEEEEDYEEWGEW